MSNFAVPQDNEVSYKEIEKKGCNVKLEVKAEASLVNKCYTSAVGQVQTKAQIQGFRAGKAPADLVKRNFPAHIQEAAIDLVVRSAAAKAIEQSKIQAVMTPLLTKADFSSLKENSPWSFEISVDVAPEVDPKDYKGIEVNKKSADVTPEEIQKNIDHLLEHNARLETLGEDALVKEDSFVVVKYSGSKNGVAQKEYTANEELIDMKNEQNIAGMTAALKGAKKGQVVKFDTKIGEDTLNFTAEVQEIKKKIMPTLDDNFAKDMGFDSVEKLKETLTNNLKEDAKNASERDFVNQIEEALVKANNFELPQSLVAYHTNLAVENFLNRMFGGKKPDLTDENRKHFAQRMQPSVEKDLRIGYLVHAIAKKENLVATEADLQAELKKALEQNPKQKTQVEKFFKERKEEILASLNEKKVFEYLKTNAKVK
ncbi:MAG: trigger factor [Elusimicrobiaceae bacterium]|nr:trigger factor [Elusimicrobiaceae bacterium]